MKYSLKYLATIVSSLGLFTINLSLSLPANASISCQRGSANYYENGSVESCNINSNVYVRMGKLFFPCQQGHSIFFDKKSQFKSCVISAPVKIITGNTVKTCPEASRVYVSFFDDGNQSVSCQQL